jgi:hypothetical protein
MIQWWHANREESSVEEGRYTEVNKSLLIMGSLPSSWFWDKLWNLLMRIPFDRPSVTWYTYSPEPLARDIRDGHAAASALTNEALCSAHPARSGLAAAPA